MTKIIIPGRKVIVTNREFDLQEGELILLLTGGRIDENGWAKSVILGVFDEIYNEDNSKFRERYGGRRYYDKRYLNLLNSMVLKRDIREPSEKYNSRNVWITKAIRQIYTPQEQIVQALQSWPGFEAHAEWVAGLRKPYLE